MELLQEANDRIYRHALEDPTAAGMGTVVTALLVDEDAGDDCDRTRRRLPRLPASRRRVRAAHARPLARRRARPRRTALDGGSRAPPAPISDHAGRRHRAERRRRDDDPPDRARRPLPGLLRRAHRHRARRADRRADPECNGGPADPEAATPEALVNAANRAGGIDNITVVLFEIIEGDPRPPPEATPSRRPRSIRTRTQWSGRPT